MPANGARAAMDAFSDRLRSALKKTERAFPHQAGGSSAARRAAPAATAKARGGAQGATNQNGNGTSASETADSFSDRLRSLLGGATPSAAPAAAASETAAATMTASGEGPVGAGDHVVRQGECISSIAKECGHFWETIWTDAGNTELREVREDPNVLLEGDRVTVPALEPKQEAGATEMRHRFVRLGEPSRLRIRVCDSAGARGNEAYVLDVDGELFEGTTDPDGKIDCPIPGNARKGKLTVGAGRKKLIYNLNLGTIDPIATTTGVQARLKNLGFRCAVDGKLTERTRAALRAFQSKNGLEPSGEIDDATRSKLKQVHGT